MTSPVRGPRVLLFVARRTARASVRVYLLYLAERM